MKLFIKLVLITIFNKKYIDWNKLNKEFSFNLACNRLMFHPEEYPFRNILNKKEINLLIKDDINRN